MVNNIDAKDVLLKGDLVVMPTDTVYGVCARAVDKSAVDRLYKLKNRHAKPGTLIASSIDQLVELGVKRRYLTAVEQFWPGAVSVVIPTGSADISYLDLGKATLAMRVVASPSLIKLLEITGPLITTSANTPGDPPATTIRQAKQYFGDQVDQYIDGGDLSEQKPSTIIRIVDDAVEVLREGAVEVSEAGNLTSKRD